VEVTSTPYPEPTTDVGSRLPAPPVPRTPVQPAFSSGRRWSRKVTLPALKPGPPSVIVCAVPPSIGVPNRVPF